MVPERKRSIRYDSRLLSCAMEKENYGGDMKTMERAGLEEEDQ